MGKARQIYQMHGLFVGPAPGSGYHFITDSGVLTNNYGQVGQSAHNLIQPILRVQGVAYEIENNRTEIKQFGKRSVVARPVLTTPTINLTFDYLQMGLINEARLGFYVNYSKNVDGYSGEPYYPNNFGVGLLSGFVTKSYQREKNEFQWPYAYRDKRNLFVAVGREGQDLNRAVYTGQDPDVQNVVAFGNSYLTSYRAQASVGAIPRCTVSYIAENMAIHASGIGQQIPALHPRSGTPITGIYYSLPSNSPASSDNRVVLPGDITIDITSTPALTAVDALAGTGIASATGTIDTIHNLGIDLRDAKIQGYTIDLPLPREPLNSLSHALPVDRRINFPVYASLNFSMIIGDDRTGSLYQLLNADDEYNVTIKLRNPMYARTGIAVQYDLRRAKVGGINFSNEIGVNKTADINFSTEVDPSDLTRGMFISGRLNTDGRQTLPLAYLLITHPDGPTSGDGGYLLQADSSKLVTEQFTLLY